MIYNNITEFRLQTINRMYLFMFVIVSNVVMSFVIVVLVKKYEIKNFLVITVSFGLQL